MKLILQNYTTEHEVMPLSSYKNNQQNEIKVMKNHPEIKKILEALPGLSIHSITDITDTVDETDTEKKKEV